ncbi:MAG: RagB/SusD family nutrient uptake outer membrane protein [Bacteroides sp.]|nr:RagB/SusD family nutrient uptake outer membrane protein [Bacteroides sp.]
MKNIKLLAYILAASFTLSTVSCNDMLDEEPRTELTSDYLKTAQGLRAGLISSYSGLRWLFGPDGSLCITIPGTDEFMTTDMLNGTQASFDTYDENLSAANESVGGFWNNGLQFINTCNAVIEYAEVSTELDDAEKTQILAEAHFLRGLYYYLVTMTYGDAPLDLGSGKLKFNVTPSTTSVRDSRADVFTAIIEDLTYAKNNLANSPSEAGRAARPAAYHFLAKAYLTRAGLECAVSTDYQNAYDTAMELINNKATYGIDLQQNYADVHLEGNENASEILFSVQRTWTVSGPNLVFDESNDGENAVANKGNRANFFFTAGYENVKVKAGGSEIAIVPRSLEYQRPWRMFLPTEWLVFNAFADKTNDARWDGAFRTEWKAGVNFKVGNRTVNTGDVAIKISLNKTETAAPEDSVGTNGVIYKPYALYYWGMLYNEDGSYNNSPVQYVYPTLTKYDDTKRAALNYDSNRPYILARLAETYLIAAEAAMYVSNGKAADLINVVRERAAYRPGLTAQEQETRKQEMRVELGDIDIDFILDERAREMCGESWRWFDLVRTGKLLERARLYNPRAKANIKDYHVLRPIPQEQIDLLSDPAQKESYQNPNY